MTESKKSGPSVLVPYPGASDDPAMQDIVVYLRPESNGVLVESTMLRIIQKDPDYKKRIFLVYLTNLPGEFVLKNHIVEEHYSIKLKFAVLGRQIFTPYMKGVFSREFGADIEGVRVVGSFEALRILSLKPEELFRYWVPEQDFLMIDGQSIKKIGDLYVVNYDIPALLHKNVRGTDIAVMIFRTSLSYFEFEDIIRRMESALLEAKILSPGVPPSRVFHYSKGPFEQLLDGIGYVYSKEEGHIPIENLSFARFLGSRGVDFSVVRGLIKNPIVTYRGPDETIKEDTIYNCTHEASYQDAYDRLMALNSQVIIR
jgi:hypothetical protein